MSLDEISVDLNEDINNYTFLMCPVSLLVAGLFCQLWFG